MVVVADLASSGLGFPRQDGNLSITAVIATFLPPIFLIVNVEVDSAVNLPLRQIHMCKFTICSFFLPNNALFQIKWEILPAKM